MNASRGGFSLAELMVALVIAGIIGIALARLLINQSRFVQTQDNVAQARSGARASYNVVTDELRMLTFGGLLQANQDSFMVRVPYAYGVACGQSAGNTHVALFPADSSTYANATPTGYAWRDTSGVLNWVTLTSVTAGSIAQCSASTPTISVQSAPGWSATVVAVAPNVVATPFGAVIFLYRQIRYSFATSAELPGRRALWRTMMPSNIREELVAPFDASSHFEYLVGDAQTLTTSPATLDSVQGVRLVMVSASQQNAPGKSVPSKFNLTTNLLFRNRVLR